MLDRCCMGVVSSCLEVFGSVHKRAQPSSCVAISQETAGDKSEEGEDDVKSAWLLRLGRHTCYNGQYNGLLSGNVELIPSKLVSVRIEVCNSTS